MRRSLLNHTVADYTRPWSNIATPNNGSSGVYWMSSDHGEGEVLLL